MFRSYNLIMFAVKTRIPDRNKEMVLLNPRRHKFVASDTW